MTLSELKLRAEQLGITAEEAKDYGPLGTKATWQAAIKDIQRRHSQEALNHAYQSPSAPVVVPLAFGAAVGEALLRNIGGMLK